MSTCEKGGLTVRKKLGLVLGLGSVELPPRAARISAVKPSESAFATCNTTAIFITFFCESS